MGWGPESWLWQIVHKPLNLLDAAYAKKWYADMSQSLHDAGGFVNHTIGSLSDAAGGWVASWTGAPASSAQAWWGAGFGVATLGFGLGVRGVAVAAGAGSKAWVSYKALSSYVSLKGVSNALYAATDDLTGGTQLQPIDAAFSMAGLGADFLAGPSVAKWLNIPGANGALQTSQKINNFLLGEVLNLNSKVWDIIGTGKDAFSAIIMDYQAGKAQQAEIPSAEVGGVLLDCCAQTLSEIGDITGAYWTDEGELVLLGRSGEDQPEKEWALPSMDAEHLQIALKAAIAGTPLGVSIDPPREFRSNRSMTEGTPMLVSYLGGVEGTLFGAILFEADRLLKCLDAGKDNITRSSFRAKVPGYRSVLDRMSMTGNQSRSWHRFWFVVEEARLRLSPSGRAIEFDSIRVKVLTETEYANGERAEEQSTADAEFARHLNDHFDDYAREFPILARLRELAKISALARWLVNSDIPMDNHNLFASKPIPVPAPTETPAVQAQRTESTTDSSGQRVATVTLTGGVELNPNIRWVNNDKCIENIAAEAQRSRPEKAMRWPLKNANGIKALALKLGMPQSCDQNKSVDDRFEHSDYLRIERIYNSARNDGDFGDGWSISVPYFLTIINASSKRSEVRLERNASKDEPPVLLLHDNQLGKAAVYRFAMDKDSNNSGKFCRVIKQERTDTGLAIQFNPSDTIKKTDSGYEFMCNRDTYRFNTKGLLTEILRNDQVLLTYSRDDGRIIGIHDAKGQGYELVYELGDTLRINSVRSTSRKNFKYVYDKMGRLVGCPSSGNWYYYDNNGKVMQRQGRNLASGETEALIGTSGSKKTSIRIGKRRGEKSEFVYNLTGKLVELKGEEARIRMEYDAGNRLKSFTQGDEERQYEYDNEGRLTAVKRSAKESIEIVRDSKSRPRKVKSNGRTTWSMDYSGPLLTEIAGVYQRLKAKWREKTLSLEVSRPGGSGYQTRYERSGRAIDVRFHHMGPIKVRCDHENNKISCESEAGTLKLQTFPYKNELKVQW